MQNATDCLVKSIKCIDGKYYAVINGEIEEVIPISHEAYDELSEEEKMNGKFYLLLTPDLAVGMLKKEIEEGTK